MNEVFFKDYLNEVTVIEGKIDSMNHKVKNNYKNIVRNDLDDLNNYIDDVEKLLKIHEERFKVIKKTKDIDNDFLRYENEYLNETKITKLSKLYLLFKKLSKFINDEEYEKAAKIKKEIFDKY